MKKIPLTQGQEAIVDDHWYDYLMQWKWLAYWDSHVQGYYAQRTDRSGGKNKQIRMHTVVAKTPQGMICDHIHHNTLDNRERELRNVTPSQNAMNRKLRSDNKLGITGVHKAKSRNGYVAKLTINGNTILNKTFPTLDEAIKTRAKFVEIHFGKFANQTK